MALRDSASTSEDVRDKSFNILSCCLLSKVPPKSDAPSEKSLAGVVPSGASICLALNQAKTYLKAPRIS